MSHFEAKVWRFVSRVSFLLFDRAIHRILPLTIPALLIFLIYEPARNYAGVIILTISFLAVVWAFYDLARGIELDHKYKEKTLRDSYNEWKQ